MKRYFYRQHKVALCTKALFGHKEDFEPKTYEKYKGIEVVVHPDGRYSVWGDLGGDEADLLRDTKHGGQDALSQALALADDSIEE